MGRDNNDPLGEGEYGVRAALPVWGDFMRKALQNSEPQDFKEPAGIVWRRIHRKTGKPVLLEEILEHEPDDEDLKSHNNPETLLEAFIEGTEPEHQNVQAPSQWPMDLLMDLQ